MKRSLFLFLASLLFFTSCGGEEAPDLSSVRAGQSSLRVSSALAGEGEVAEVLPAALAGIRAGTLLSFIAGADIPPPLTDDTVGAVEANEDIALLERFVELLKVDVRTLLNRSANRQATFDEYVTSLTSHTTRAEIRSRSLTQREDELKDDERRLKGNVRDLQNDLEAAIEAGEGRSATALMNDVLSQQTRLAKVSTELTVVQSLRRSFDDVVKPLQERLSAVRANEDALVRGVQVVDLPGVEDLGIIKVEEGIRRLRDRTGSSRGIGTGIF